MKKYHLRALLASGEDSYLWEATPSNQTVESTLLTVLAARETEAQRLEGAELRAEVRSPDSGPGPLRT